MLCIFSMQPWVTAAHGSVSDIIDSVVFLYLAGQIICFRFFGFFTGNLSADVAAMTKDFGSYPGNRSERHGVCVYVCT